MQQPCKCRCAQYANQRPIQYNSQPPNHTSTHRFESTRPQVAFMLYQLGSYLRVTPAAACTCLPTACCWVQSHCTLLGAITLYGCNLVMHGDCCVLVRPGLLGCVMLYDGLGTRNPTASHGTSGCCCGPSNSGRAKSR